MSRRRMAGCLWRGIAAGGVAVLVAGSAAVFSAAILRAADNGVGAVGGCEREAVRMSGGGADRDISLLFDVFVVHQRVRALLAQALSGSELRADEYAVYSVLFERGSLTPTQLAACMAMPVTTTRCGAMLAPITPATSPKFAVRPSLKP